VIGDALIGRGNRASAQPPTVKHTGRLAKTPLAALIVLAVLAFRDNAHKARDGRFADYVVAAQSSARS
jgi:hypothetical protein